MSVGMCGQKRHFCDTLLDTEASGDGRGCAGLVQGPDRAAMYKVAVTGPRTGRP